MSRTARAGTGSGGLELATKFLETIRGGCPTLGSGAAKGQWFLVLGTLPLGTVTLHRPSTGRLAPHGSLTLHNEKSKAWQAKLRHALALIARTCRRRGDSALHVAAFDAMNLSKKTSSRNGCGSISGFSGSALKAMQNMNSLRQSHSLLPELAPCEESEATAHLSRRFGLLSKEPFRQRAEMLERWFQRIGAPLRQRETSLPLPEALFLLAALLMLAMRH